jgi:threonine dehydratase
MKILFVCLGNICRSPLAEGILQHKARKHGLPVEVDSAGFERFHVGDGADPRSQRVAAQNGINLANHTARLFRIHDFDHYDRIYVMDSHNFSDVMSVARNEDDRKKVDFILNLAHPGSNKPVPDPYYGGKDGFEKIFSMLNEACDILTEELIQIYERKLPEMNHPIPDLETIRQASARIKPYAHRTPVLTSESVSRISGARIWFKCENLQKGGAFKFRGATNAVFSLTSDQIIRGVATHSSGNHAQALALAARMRGCPAYIVMPENSSSIKVQGVREYGGRITFCNPTLSSREETLAEVIRETGTLEIHPYNDYRIIAGQATAAMELLEDVPDLDVVMAPVGGGGLLSGTALVSHYLSPAAMVIAGEPLGASDAYRSFYSGHFVPSENPVTIADGLLTSLGTLTFPIITKYVKRIITVREESIVLAMKTVWERMKIIIEPSSAVPLAAILENRVDFEGLKVGIIISGGNVNLEKLPW